MENIMENCFTELSENETETVDEGFNPLAFIGSDALTAVIGAGSAAAVVAAGAALAGGLIGYGICG